MLYQLHFPLRYRVKLLLSRQLGMLALLAFSLLIFSLLPSIAFAVEVPDSIIKTLKAGQAVDVIIEYEAADIEQVAETMRKKKPRQIDDDEVKIYKRKAYKTLKDKVDNLHGRKDIVDVKVYQYMPMTFKRFKTEKALNKYIAVAGVKAVYENQKMQRFLSQSLPLINQPSVATAGAQGAGVTVAVLDDGINFTHPVFGSCTAPNVPSATCKIIVTNSFADVPNTASSHGTNVAAIVLGVAPAAKIAALNVFGMFNGSSVAFTADIIEAIDWVIANKATYNIVAINLSLGSSSTYNTPCLSEWSTSAVTNAKNAGITVVAATGNSADTDGIGSPACAPAALSVGAVYDSNVGRLDFGYCLDSTTAADKVTCFSNSAGIMTMLAPGAPIVAADITRYGTSQAAPHVAGAVAVLRSLYPTETLNQTQTRLTSTGTPVLDSRNNITKPRLNLLAAARPKNDAFASRISLTGTTANITGQSIVASKESAETNHAGITGGASVWWKWVATQNGQVSLSTTGSSFDTLLAVYQGSSLSALTPVVANNNETSSTASSRVYWQAVAGTEYQIAVDGVNATAGQVNLTLSLNNTAAANLSLSVDGPTAVLLGQTADYTLTIQNAGPQTATNAKISVTIPTGASLAFAPSTCSLSANVVTCLAPLVLNGASQAFTIQLLWNSLSAPVSLIANVSSDLTDGVSTNNSSNLQISLNTNLGGSDNNDAPTLPEWAALLLAATLIGQASLARRHKS